MKKIAILTFLIICPVLSQDLDVNRYFTSFRKEAFASKTMKGIYLERMNKVIIRMAKIDEISDHLAAICKTETNEVLLNYHEFIKKTEMEKQEIIDHELGHCVLLRSHYNESTLSYLGENPTNIMHHKVFPYKSVKQMKEYRKELFKEEYYGTIIETEKKYREMKKQDEMVISSSGKLLIVDESHKLRAIEHTIMQERINKYIKSKN